MIGLQVVARDFEEEQAVDGLGEEEEERKVSATAVTGGASLFSIRVELTIKRRHNSPMSRH